MVSIIRSRGELVSGLAATFFYSPKTYPKRNEAKVKIRLDQWLPYPIAPYVYKDIPPSIHLRRIVADTFAQLLDIRNLLRTAKVAFSLLTCVTKYKFVLRGVTEYKLIISSKHRSALDK